MIDDVVRNKVARIERCLQRVRERYQNDPARLDDQDIEDVIVLNLQRACEGAIDLAIHLVARERLGVPQSSADAFELLRSAGRLDPALALRMKKMVGFRNVVVHEYERLDRAVLLAILDRHLGDFEAFCRAAAAAP